MKIAGSIGADLARRGFRFVAGCDEAGRGPLAGPVVAAAVILPAKFRLPGLDDSKKLIASQREKLAGQIREQAVAFAVGQASPGEIDRLNILAAAKLAMQRAVLRLNPKPDFVLVDAVALNLPEIPQLALIRGDARESAIAAASILAKTFRDELMTCAALKYPGFGFERHFGYPTAAHYRALAELGPCPLHRRSFRLG